MPQPKLKNVVKGLASLQSLIVQLKVNSSKPNWPQDLVKGSIMIPKEMNQMPKTIRLLIFQEKMCFIFKLWNTPTYLFKATKAMLKADMQILAQKKNGNNWQVHNLKKNGTVSELCPIWRDNFFLKTLPKRPVSFKKPCGRQWQVERRKTKVRKGQ